MSIQMCRVCLAETVFFQEVNDIIQEQCFISSSYFTPKTDNMGIFKCPVCTHMQIENKLPQDYYSNNQNEDSGASQYFGSLDLFEEKIKKLKNFAVNNEKLMDIGCGTGHALSLAESIFSKCVGIEPAKNVFKAAQSKGLNVINNYFTRGLNLENDFSAFMSFQVFEHLDDIYSVLDAANEKLIGNGVGLINVPNGQKIINHSLFHQLTFEHINYFTPNSLAVMAHRAGFDIIEINSIDKTIEVDIFVRKSGEQSLINSVKDKQKMKLQQITGNFDGITIWGAGAKSLKYSALLSKNTAVKYVVDSSMNKRGKYIGGINKAIEAPSQSIIDDSNLVIIFASSYNEEIIMKIRNEYKFKGAIAYFDRENVLLDIYGQN